MSFVLSVIAAAALAAFVLAVVLNQAPAAAERLALATVMASEFWVAFRVRRSTGFEPAPG